MLPERADVIRREPAKQQTDGARGRHGYSQGRHVFEFTFNDKPWGSHCGVGLCTEHSALSLKGELRKYYHCVSFQVKSYVELEM